MSAFAAPVPVLLAIGFLPRSTQRGNHSRQQLTLPAWLSGGCSHRKNHRLKGARQENHVPPEKSVLILTMLLYSLASFLHCLYRPCCSYLRDRKGQGGGAHLAVRYDIVAFSAGSV